MNIIHVDYWEPPMAGTFMLNLDGAIFTSIGAMGIGAILRNNRGEAM